VFIRPVRASHSCGIKSPERWKMAAPPGTIIVLYLTFLIARALAARPLRDLLSMRRAIQGPPAQDLVSLQRVRPHRHPGLAADFNAARVIAAKAPVNSGRASNPSEASRMICAQAIHRQSS
jgi:hypothetical protein